MTMKLKDYSTGKDVYVSTNTYLIRKDTSPPNTDGVYMLPTWLASRSDGLVFLL